MYVCMYVLLFQRLDENMCSICHLLHRTSIQSPAVCPIANEADRQHSQEYHAGPVEVLRGDRDGRGEEHEE